MLLRQKANFGVLEGFLTVFIGEPITILEILENHGEPRIVEGKSSSSKSKTFMRCIT